MYVLFDIPREARIKVFMEGTLEFHEFVFLKPLGAPKL